MFARFKREKAEEGFGNILSVANESAIIRDLILEDMGAEVDPPIEAPLDLSPTDLPGDDDQTEDDDMDDDTSDEDEDLEDIPETDIVDASADADDVMNANVPEDADEYVGGSDGAADAEIESVIPKIISSWEKTY